MSPYMFVIYVIIIMMTMRSCCSFMLLSPTRKVLQSTISIATRTGYRMTSSNNDIQQFAGSYSDPNHMNCQRDIVIKESNSNEVVLNGADGDPHCSIDGSGTKYWKLIGMVDGNTISVDFTPKGGPKNVIGIYEADGSSNYITWPDGNRWTKI